MDHVIGAGVRGISKGIALASEVVAARKDKNDDKTAETNIHTRRRSSGSQDEEEEGVDVVAQQWQLDKAGSGINGVNVVGGVVEEDTTELANIEDSNVPLQPLPLPVIIPQRRPGSRSRGFVRAYAPSLGECSNISQEAFLQFLNDFDIATRTSPIFDVINLACFGVGLVPGTICMAVSTSVGTVNQIAREIQERYRTNQFLDNANDRVYKPRGLYCMIMAYRPDLPDEAVLRANVSDDIHGVSLQKILDLEDSSLKSRLAHFRAKSGTVRNDLQIPGPAPLVYPMLDKAIEMAAVTANTPAALPGASSTSAGLVIHPSDITNALQHTESTSSPDSALAKLTAITNMPAVQDYLDRRAQTEFVVQNPHSKLSTALPPQKKYVNRFADPDHPVNSGSIFGLVTGGTFDPIARGRVRRAERKTRRRGEEPLTEQEKHDAYMGRKVRGRVTGTPSKKIPFLSKILKQDILYLVIVNLPSEQEIQSVLSELE